MSKYGFNAHVASDKRKWILVTIAIILLAAFMVLIVLTNLFTDWNKYCVFGHTYENGAEVCSKCGKELPIEVEPDEPADVVPDEPAEETPEDNVIVEPEEPTEEMALRTRKIAKAAYGEDGISPQAESAYQLTATVTPANAMDQVVDWSVEWVNPSSQWATDKSVTDYVTITPTADGALTANLECSQAFGEQVKVVVAHRLNSSITASATVDYVKRATNITNVELDFGGIVFDGSTIPTYDIGPIDNWENNFLGQCQDFVDYVHGLDYTVTFGTGTLTQNYTLKSLELSVNKSAISNKDAEAYHSFGIRNPSVHSEYDVDTIGYVVYALYGTWIHMAWESLSDSELIASLHGKFNAAGPVTAKYTFEGASIGDEFEVSFQFKMSVASQYISLLGLSLNSSEILF